jgi:hypothetical protein
MVPPINWLEVDANDMATITEQLKEVRLGVRAGRRNRPLPTPADCIESPPPGSRDGQVRARGPRGGAPADHGVPVASSL